MAVGLGSSVVEVDAQGVGPGDADVAEAGEHVLERRLEPPVELDGVHGADARGERRGQHARAGPHLDGDVVGVEVGEPQGDVDDVAVDEEVLAEARVRRDPERLAGPTGRAARPPPLSPPGAGTPGWRAASTAAASASGAAPRSAATKRRVSMTYAGSFGRPRCGTGDEVRRVGLQQEQLVRHAPRGVLQVDGAAVGDVAGEGAVPAALDRLVEPLHGGEAVQHHGRRRLVGEDREAVVGRLAAVDDDGQLELAARARAGRGRPRAARRAARGRGTSRGRSRRSPRSAGSPRGARSRPPTSSLQSAAWCGCSPAVVQTSSCAVGERGRLGHLPLAGADRDQPRRRRPRGRAPSTAAGSSLQLVTCVWVSITRWARRRAGTARRRPRRARPPAPRPGAA